MNWIKHYKSPYQKESLFSPVNICLYLAVLLLPMKRATSLGWFGLPEEITLPKIFLFLAFVLWLARAIIAKNPSLLSLPVKTLFHTAIILELATSIFSLFKVTEIDVAIPVFIRTGGVLVLYFLLINIMHDRRTFQKVITVFLLGVAVNGLAGMYELISQEPIMSYEKVFSEELPRSKSELVKEAGGIRVQGLVGDANYNTHLSVIAIGIVLGSIFSRWSNISKLNRMLLGSLLAILVIICIVSASRMGWISLGVCIFTFILFVPSRNKSLLITASVLFISIVFSGVSLFSDTPVLSRITGSSGSHSITWRIAYAKLSLIMFKSNPILGTGVGNYVVVKNRWDRNVPDFKEFGTASGSVNGYLYILVEKGLVGLLSYLLVIVSFIYILSHMIISSRDVMKKIMSLGLLSSFLGHLTYMNTLAVQYSELMYLMFGLGIAIFSLRDEGFSITSREKTPSERWVTFPFIGGASKRNRSSSKWPGIISS